MPLFVCKREGPVLRLDPRKQIRVGKHRRLSLATFAEVTCRYPTDAICSLTAVFHEKKIKNGKPRSEEEIALLLECATFLFLCGNAL